MQAIKRLPHTAIVSYFQKLVLREKEGEQSTQHKSTNKQPFDLNLK